MSTVFAERPHYFEGQYLGAADLEALIVYLREQQARHLLGAHTWGVVAGIDLVDLSSPNGDAQYFLTPGVAVDGYGRMIVVAEPYALGAELFTAHGSGLVPVWIRHDENATGGVRRGFEVCDALDAYQRISESFVVETGVRSSVSTRQSGVAVADRTYTDAREAAGWYLSEEQAKKPLSPDGSVAPQLLPLGDDPSLWLVPVGCVPWQQGAPGQLQPPTEAWRKQSRVLRGEAGLVAGSIYAAAGLLRLRTRFVARDPTLSVDEVCRKAEPTVQDLIICDDHMEFREPIWLEANTRFLGDARLYGKRLEFQAAGGSDYAAGAPVTALRRAEPAAIELQLLLGDSGDTKKPTRFVVGKSKATNTTNPCQLDFDFTPGFVVQQDGHVGIGTASTQQLPHPLTVRGGDAGVLAIQDDGGTVAWQLRVATNKSGLAITRANPADTRLFVGDNGVGIGIDAPGAKLDVRGDIRHGDNGELFALGGEQALRTVAGRVAAGGSVLLGAGFTAAKLSTGTYRITFSRAFATTPVVTATANDSNVRAATVHSASAGLVDVHLCDLSGTLQDQAFSFIAIGAT